MEIYIYIRCSPECIRCSLYFVRSSLPPPRGPNENEDLAFLAAYGDARGFERLVPACTEEMPTVGDRGRDGVTARRRLRRRIVRRTLSPLEIEDLIKLRSLRIRFRRRKEDQRAEIGIYIYIYI